MNINDLDDSKPAYDMEAVFYALIRHKWKILVFTLAGVGLALLVHVYSPVVFESEAKLLVRYVLDRSAIDSVESHDGNSGFKQNDSVIASEADILTSWDLAMETAEAIGVKRLAPGPASPDNDHAAATTIHEGLTVTARPGSNVIIVAYQHEDPKMATAVLKELVGRYFAKHLEVHRSTGAFDFVSQQTEQMRAQLKQTDEQLMRMKSGAGIISLGESTTSLTSQLAKSQSELLAAEAKRSELIARVREIERWAGGGAAPNETAEIKGEPSPGSEDASTTGPARPSSSDIQKHQALHERIAVLRQSELELLSKFTPENELVTVSQAQIRSLDEQRRALEAHFPSLAAVTPTKTAAPGAQPDLVSERAGLAAVEAKLQTIRSQVREGEEAVRKFSDLSTQIAELERRKEVAETNYKYFESSLEKARIDEALDPTKMPNISIVQKPSVAMPVVGHSSKVVLLLAVGGLFLGIAIALFRELVMDRSVKRASEIETKLGIPLLRSIPFVARRSRSPQSLKNGEHSPPKAIETLGANQRHGQPPAWERGHFIRSYCDALRDRMILFFELGSLTHKPKLLGITACSAGAGTSTIAAGLAASLSETGDGKVLLVDMDTEQAAAHPFFDGSPSCALSEAIEPGKQITSAADNLYLATTQNGQEGSMRLAPRRFYELLPSLKASDFDYIIFDMPPLSRSGVGLALAGLMDKVILVIEAEGVDRDTVKRDYEELVGAKASISCVVNKARSYGPKWFGLEN